MIQFLVLLVGTSLTGVVATCWRTIRRVGTPATRFADGAVDISIGALALTLIEPARAISRGEFVEWMGPNSPVWLLVVPICFVVATGVAINAKAELESPNALPKFTQGIAVGVAALLAAFALVFSCAYVVVRA